MTDDEEEHVGACRDCVPREVQRPNDDDPLPEPPSPPRRYSRRWCQEYLGVIGDNDD